MRDAEYDTAGEDSKAVNTGGAPYISDGDPNVLNANRNDEGRWVNANIDRPLNQWNDDGAFAFPVPATLSVLPRQVLAGEFLFRAVRRMFAQLPLPSAKHFTDLVHPLRHLDIFFVFERIGFPQHHQQHFQGVDLARGEPHVRQFFLA